MRVNRDSGGGVEVVVGVFCTASTYLDEFHFDAYVARACEI